MTTFPDLDALISRLDSLADIQRVLPEPMTRALALLHDEMFSNPPRKKPGAFSRLATPGQKRAYWARVGAGEIDHREGIGYVRSNVLTLKSVSSVEPTSNGIRGTIGTVGYGRYVVGREQQQGFHAESGWTTDDAAFKAVKDDMLAEFREAIERALRR